MEYNEEDFLQLSGIQHFAFCRRQWALIHIDGVWSENQRTIEGKLLHENVHDTERKESRGDRIISRGMPVFSRKLGLSGSCDAVEFHRAEDGITLSGRAGRYTVYPVEYKRGEPKSDDCDLLQLTAQAICLEEMLCCRIDEGALFYFETAHRLKVTFTEALREQVRRMTAEMHEDYIRRYLPKPRRTRSCNACSLKEQCLPQLAKLPSARVYNAQMLGEEEIL